MDQAGMVLIPVVVMVMMTVARSPAVVGMSLRSTRAREQFISFYSECG